MTDLQEFASSSNGDKWFFGKDAATSRLFVLHRGNAASGGHDTSSSVDAFLNQQPFGPEREARVVFPEKNKNSEDTCLREDAETPSLRLAERIDAWLGRGQSSGPSRSREAIERSD